MRCNLGVGCDEAGVCYAAANGKPERCGMPLADKLEPRIHVTVTRSLAFAALCGIARAPRFWLGWVVGSGIVNAGWLLARWLP